jgi:2-oxoglutarate ferredoxin oxidoreductase subunit alpha
MTKNTLEAVKDFGLSQKEGVRCKNMYALGLVYWLYGRDRAPTTAWLKEKFGSRPEIANANIAAVNAGHAFGETIEVSGETSSYQIAAASIKPGLYRTITGIDAISYGLITGAEKAHLKITYAGYPITPASAILHNLSKLKQFDVVTFQAEDEIAAVCAALGGSYAGTLGVTASSGPGIALKTEAIGLAISVELPLVIINVQRAGPSTGMPTKTEQSDLHQAVFGRNADSPLVVIAASTPSDNFDVAIEAVRLATKYMTPVMLLTDGYLANASEPWMIPDIDTIPEFPAKFLTDTVNFSPTNRDPKTLARNWPIPGTPNLEHRIGGIEKSYETGNISYDATNHQKMTDVRKNKIDGIANDIPLQEITRGDNNGDVAVIGWGSTFGAITQAVEKVRVDGYKVSHIHIRHIWPLPKNLKMLLSKFKDIIVAEMNTGQLITVLRSEFLVDAQGLNKVSGQPFKVSEIEEAIRNSLEN